jgi:hypothetical protein
MIEDYPTFALFWAATSKVGRKELYSKRWLNIPKWKQIEIYNKALSAKPKQHPETYLNIGR